MPISNAKVKSLQEKRAAIDARLKQIAALDKARIRKQDLQRKILLGEYYLTLAKRKGKLPELVQLMLQNLSRETDKQLFANLISNDEG